MNFPTDPNQSKRFTNGISEIDPINALLEHGEGAALAIISHIDGPSYRPLGAMMAIFPDGHSVGNLSSGCIDADVIHQAKDAITEKRFIKLRYGEGSPYFDIKLPCGGGLEISVIPNPSLDVLRKVSASNIQRVNCTLEMDRHSGNISYIDQYLVNDLNYLRVLLKPDIKFEIFGKGPEAVTFSALVSTAGYDAILSSPDDETIRSGLAYGCETRKIIDLHSAPNLDADERTAVALFFHEHEWETEILKSALNTDAFYIGAQGSQRTAKTRVETLKSLEVTEEQIARISGPIGLVPSAKDPRTLAVSVLAEILATMQKQENG